MQKVLLPNIPELKYHHHFNATQLNFSFNIFFTFAIQHGCQNWDLTTFCFSPFERFLGQNLQQQKLSEILRNIICTNIYFVFGNTTVLIMSKT